MIGRTTVLAGSATMRLIALCSVLAALAFLLPPTPATAIPITWNTTTGDWFLPGNWDPNQVPGGGEMGDQAIINNGGTAQISAGSAIPGGLSIASSPGSSGNLSVSGGSLACGSMGWEVVVGGANGSIGTVTQSGGVVDFSGAKFDVGRGPGATGSYNLLAGTLQGADVSFGIGPGGTGQFTQSGGVLRLYDRAIRVGAGDGSGTGQCSFSGGTQSLHGITVYKTGTVGISGSAALSAGGIGLDQGQFNQSGGGVTLTGGLSIGGTGAAYSLSGVGATLSAGSISVWGPGQFNETAGAATAGSIVVYDQGQVNQSGGSMHVTTLLDVRVGGRYSYTGGTLDIGNMLNVEGQFDFGGQAVTLNVGSVPTGSSVSLWNGTIANGSNATLNVYGADSFVVLAPGQNNAFGTFYNEGTTYFTGGTLVVQAGKTVRLVGSFPDHAQVQGTLGNIGGYLNLNNGLEVSGSGVVDLGSGTLNVKDMVSGVAGSGQLSVGSLLVAETGTASFALNGGSIWCDRLGVALGAGSNGYLSVSSGTLSLGGMGTEVAVGGAIGSIGTVTQSGGVVDISGTEFYLGTTPGSTGSYDLLGGTLQGIEARLAVGFDAYGSGATGSFTQSGGVLRLYDFPMNLGAHTGSGTGQCSFSGGTQSLAGVNVYKTGTLAVSGSAALSAGSIALAEGKATQTGGGVTLSGPLTLGGTGSIYNICAGLLKVWDLNVDNGTFNISGPDANIEVRNNLRFGPNAIFQAVPGATIHMTGAAFQNERRDPTSLEGLSDLTLIFEGGPATVDTFEVAGRDFGPLMQGFTDNFELHALILGGANVGNVRLVDYFDNVLSWSGREALYVDRLEVGPGSTLDLNGLDLYYRTASIDPTAVIEYNGGHLSAAVPEPMTLGTLALGLGAVFARRRRRPEQLRRSS